jgi:hypothetical protein
MHCVTLAESQIFKSIGELGLFVNQTRGGLGRAGGEKSGRKSRRKNDRCDFHGYPPVAGTMMLALSYLSAYKATMFVLTTPFIRTQTSLHPTGR